MKTIEETSGGVLSLKELLGLLWKGLPSMVLAAVLCCAGVFVWSSAAAVPQYSSTAVLYILPQTEQGEDFELALEVTEDCVYLLSSRTVLEDVIRKQALPLSWKQLQRRVEVNNPKNSRVLELSVRLDEPRVAKEAADALCAAGMEQVSETLGVPALRVVEPGTLEAEPCNALPGSAYILTGFLACAGVYALSLVRRLYWR